MKRYLLAGTALAVLPSASFADSAPFSWNGFYLGAQAGVASNRASSSGSYLDGGGSSVWSSRQSWTSGLVGGFAGYDHRLGRFVIGIEGDVNARVGSRTSSLPAVRGINIPAGWQSEADMDASIRARFGVLAAEQVLLYMTAGVAFGKFTFSNPLAGTPGAVYFGTQNIYGGNRTGWTLGTGAQFAITPNLNARFEYRHSDFGTKSGIGGFDIGKGPGRGPFQAKITDDRVTSGLAYKF